MHLTEVYFNKSWIYTKILGTPTISYYIMFSETVPMAYFDT